jgi:FKBP-type peptidyl-prolyl cis-trans isomerase
MRRTLKPLVLIAIPALVALSACSSSGGGSGATPGTTPTANASQATSELGADLDITVSGQYGKQPSVSIPAAKAGPDLMVKTILKGSGPAISDSTVAYANYVTYLWDGSANKLVGDTYVNAPEEFLASQEIPGLATALNGRTEGSRILAVIPPADAYGTSGDPEEGVSGSDTLVFVIDIVGAFAPEATVSGSMTQAGAGLPTVSGTVSPKVTIPSTAPPSTLEAKTLVKGTGAVVKAGNTIVTQYTGVNWRTGKVFDSSWSRKEPLGVEVGASPAQVITGWNALEGQTVGSRVLLIIPPKDGYGKAGESKAGIKGTDTLVFVVDILAAYK